jgi:hypothetical protein
MTENQKQQFQFLLIRSEKSNFIQRNLDSNHILFPDTVIIYHSTKNTVDCNRLSSNADCAEEVLG